MRLLNWTFTADDAVIMARSPVGDIKVPVPYRPTKHSEDLYGVTKS